MKTAKQQLSRNPSNAGYATPLKSYTVPAMTNEDGTISVPVQPVVIVNSQAEPATQGNTVQAILLDNAGVPIVSGAANYLGTLGNDSSLSVLSRGYVTTGTGWEPLRTPIVFKTLGLTTAAGDTALWDPAAGKKFRLMGVIVDIAAGTTAAGACVLQLRDQAVVISNHTICGGALAASAGRMLVNHVLPGNGYLSVAADNILNLNLSSVLAAGGVTAFAYGTEE